MNAQHLPVKTNQKKSNLRLGLILASVALVFFLGFIGKMVLFTG